MNFDSTRVKIDLDAISRNFDAVREKAGVKVMAVVKADAYGHGAIQVARLLQDKCAFFGVSSMLEAMELRKAGLTTPILVLGHMPVNAYPTAIAEGIRPTIFHYEDAQALSRAAQELNLPAPFHFAVDTGMSRLGFQATEEAADICLKCGALDVFISATQERNEAIWSARGAFLEAIKNSTTEMDECDVVVPRRHVAEFVMYSHELQQKHHIRIRSFGHAGDGNLHIYILRDELDEKTWELKLTAVFADLYHKAAELGGKVSGEHGIGFAKRPYLAESLSPAEQMLMQGIKQVFDPKNILNPGKVIGA